MSNQTDTPALKLVLEELSQVSADWAGYLCEQARSRTEIGPYSGEDWIARTLSVLGEDHVMHVYCDQAMEALFAGGAIDMDELDRYRFNVLLQALTLESDEKKLRTDDLHLEQPEKLYWRLHSYRTTLQAYLNPEFGLSEEVFSLRALRFAETLAAKIVAHSPGYCPSSDYHSDILLLGIDTYKTLYPHRDEFLLAGAGRPLEPRIGASEAEGIGERAERELAVLFS